MNTKSITSAWAAVPDRPALMEECRQRVSALGCIEDIIDWLRGIECPFTQEATLRVFRDYWHDLESRLDDIAVWRSYNRCELRYPGMDDTVSSLIRLAQERQKKAETDLLSSAVSDTETTSATTPVAETKLLNITPASACPKKNPVASNNQTIMNVTINGNANIFEAGSVTGNQSVTITCGSPDQQDIIGKEEKTPSNLDKKDDFFIPEPLRSETAQMMLRKAQLAGLLDEDLQPICSRTMGALLANEISERLNLATKWVVFEQLWSIKQLSSYYDRALSLKRMTQMQAEIEAALI